MSRVFEPFYSTKRGGMGIGLSICRTIIEAHDRRLAKQNNAHGGSLLFALPIANTPAETSGQSR